MAEEFWMTRVTMRADDCRMVLEMPADNQEADEVVTTALRAFRRTGALHDDANLIDIRLRYFDRNATPTQHEETR